ncbi:MAG: hypothetical protein CBC49_007000 [Alphaproteobacteria bacterium TMED89]|nr:MAG: hypothetical protein CBC49_007000 [Alphaproteobacteria bacterium TMED89]
MPETTTIKIYPQDIHFKLVTTQLEMMHVAAVRGICNLEEVGVPAQHEFDDNDNFATHALGYYKGEPISAVHMRFFGDFVKLERACVRPKYRNRHILPRAIDLVARFAGQKGYRHIVTHAKPATARLWCMLGFEISDKTATQFVGHEQGYLELVKEIPLRNDAVSLAAASALMFRQENSLDRPNDYEIAA